MFCGRGDKLYHEGYDRLPIGLVNHLVANGASDLNRLTCGDDPKTYNGRKILDAFSYAGKLRGVEDAKCVCGVRIKHVHMVVAKGFTAVPCLIGRCCIKEWCKHSKSLDQAIRDMKLSKNRERFIEEMHRRCAACGRVNRDSETIVHANCIDDYLLLDLAKPSPFIESLRSQDYLSRRQRTSLISRKWWSTDRLLRIYDAFNPKPIFFNEEEGCETTSERQTSEESCTSHA